ncbi:uncharacterized protein [Penaeus vannamei]|uniref:uncharacterized protein n=1 Tax=Penaeus vannamei TaxID=6689 RepID=UPI00387F5B0E
MAVKIFGVILGVLPHPSGSQCHCVKRAILSVLQITVTISTGVGYGTLYVVYLWIPGYEDVEMSMKVTEALCAVSQFICSLLIVLWMWKHSRSLSSVIKTCSTTPGGTQPPDVSPHLILTPRVAVNQLLLWFIIIQAVYEGILYGLWYMIYDMNIVSVFLKVLFLILQLWITLIIRYPQIMWVAIGTALQHQFARFNRAIEDAARSRPRLPQSRPATPPPAAESGDGIVVVNAARSHEAKDDSECRERDDKDANSCDQAERSAARDASSDYQKARANLAYIRERYQELQQVLREGEAVMAGPLLISSFYTFSSTIICLFHGIALDISVIFKILTMTQCGLQIIILWIQGQVADSIIAEGQKTSQILLEVAEAATGRTPLPPKAKQTILIMSMERLSRKGLGTRVCGLFMLSRRNTLAVAGASTSYLLILLQFHLADL